MWVRFDASMGMRVLMSCKNNNVKIKHIVANALRRLDLFHSLNKMQQRYMGWFGRLFDEQII